MKLKRTIPPAAAPIGIPDILSGFYGVFCRRTLLHLEEEMNEFFSAKYVFFLNSGKAALTVILESLKLLKETRHGIIPSYTCYSVPSSLLQGAIKVKLCDLGIDSFDFDYQMLEEKIDENTLCVVQNHLFGIPSQVERVKRLCEEKGVFLIEDAAQSMGVEEGGAKLGTIGDVGFFSLGRGKNISAGSGGIILTNSDDIGEALGTLYKNVKKEPFFDTWMNFLAVKIMCFFIHPSLYWIPAGLPFLNLGATKFYPHISVRKMEGSRAGFLRNWREKLARENRIRTQNGRYIRERLSHIFPNYPYGGNETPYLRFPLLLENKEMKEKGCLIAKKKGLGISGMYPLSLNKLMELGNMSDEGEYPLGERVAERLVTLPTHSFMREMDLERHCDFIKKIYEGKIQEES